VDAAAAGGDAPSVADSGPRLEGVPARACGARAQQTNGGGEFWGGGSNETGIRIR
jgi:hypothetical protein